MKEYLKSSAEVMEELGTTAQGISESKAEDLLEKNGKNKLKEGKKESLISKFLKQYCFFTFFIHCGQMGLQIPIFSSFEK